jgi:ABC-type dipeptide/oligopeptide/nickel transport system permease component
MGLLVACVTFYRARDWRIFRILVIPTTLAVGSELGVAVEWLPSDTHLYAAAFFGALVALTMVVLSVCGPSPRSIRVQYVATAIGIVAPPVACILSLLTPSTVRLLDFSVFSTHDFHWQFMLNSLTHFALPVFAVALA